MEQEEIRENAEQIDSNSSANEKDSKSEDASGDLSALADSENPDNLPVESIGSYGRIEELMEGKGTEKHGRADSEN